jgi:hypothetical protein
LSYKINGRLIDQPTLFIKLRLGICYVDMRHIDRNHIQRHADVTEVKLPFAALTNVERWRSGVGADSRDMGELFDSGPVCLNCHPPGSFDVYGMKSFPSVLDVKADRIDSTVSAGKHIGNGPLVVNVGLY